MRLIEAANTQDSLALPQNHPGSEEAAYAGCMIVGSRPKDLSKNFNNLQLSLALPKLAA
jgi:hypothetical protein